MGSTVEVKGCRGYESFFKEVYSCNQTEKALQGFPSSLSYLDTRLKTELAPAPFIQPEIGDQIEESSRGEASPLLHTERKSNVPQDYTFITQK